MFSYITASSAEMFGELRNRGNLKGDRADVLMGRRAGGCRMGRRGTDVPTMRLIYR